MKNVIITGSSGMVGGLILQECLDRADVAKVTTVGRRSSGIKHPKLREVIHKDFLHFDPQSDWLQNQQVCYFCIGVYTGTVDRERFREITVDYTRLFAEALKAANGTDISFCFLSGQGADSSEKSRVAFAKDKGIAENTLKRLSFSKLHIFRPGYIYPVTPRQEPNFTYRIMRWLYPRLMVKIYPNIGLTSAQLAATMTEVGLNGGDLETYENNEIRLHPAAAAHALS